MRRSFYRSGTAALTLIVLAGCGITVRPHARTGGAEQPPGLGPGGGLTPRPTPEVGVVDDASPVVDQVCRTEAMRAGWVATRYIQGVKECPESTDPGNPYTGAVIERYSHKPVGAIMVVCADQSIPRQWVRDRGQDVRATCPGARVRDGEPTIMVIRRVADGTEHNR